LHGAEFNTPPRKAGREKRPGERQQVGVSPKRRAAFSRRILDAEAIDLARPLS
jgi:hypothetical protein